MQTFQFTSLFLSTALLSVAFIPQASHAGDASAHDLLEDWEFVLGAAAIAAPDYQGSDDYSFTALPLLEATWNDRITLSTREGLIGHIYDDKGFYVGAGIGYDFGRDEDDNDALKGLGDIDAAATGKIMASYSYEAWTIGATLEQDLTNAYDGMTVDLELTWQNRFLNDRLMLIAGPGIHWASEDYMQSFFGVTAAQSLRSGYAKTDAGAGVRAISFSVNGRYALDQNWGLLAFAQYEQLMGDAADSPITQDEGQMLLGLGVDYRF